MRQSEWYHWDREHNGEKSKFITDNRPKVPSNEYKQIKFVYYKGRTCYVLSWNRYGTLSIDVPACNRPSYHIIVHKGEYQVAAYWDYDREIN